MSATRTGSRVGLAVTGAAGVWVAALSWRGFTEAWPAALVPLVGIGAAVALGGAALRRFAVPGALVVLAQLLLGVAATSVVLTGSPVPVGAAGTALVRALEQAVESSTTYAAPVPADAPGIEPLLVVGGLACFLLVDALACTLRRVPLAGLPLLAVYSVPVGILGSGAGWWIFVATATAFLLMLHLDAGDAVTRWGRALAENGPTEHGPAGDASGFGMRTGAAAAGAGALGAGAVALAVAIPLALPALDLDLLGGGSGSGGNGDILVTNPMVDLRRDLRQVDDVPLVRVRTDDPDPAYLRISVLANFTENEWTSGDRSVPDNQVADGALPPIEGLDPGVARESYAYEVEVTDALSSTWLPTQAPVSRVQAPGDWRFDLTTSDFIAATDDLTTSGLTYEMTSVEPQVGAADLAAAPAERGEVDSRFLQLPTGLPPVVGSLTNDVTAGLANNFDRAVALQDFFRTDGGFRYSLASEDGNGADELAAFLTPGPDGRIGYCEQFASAMAVMARQVGIPSRVAVGFLAPSRLEDGRWEYSSDDLHAWPELYFPGAGWTRFEPTPPRRAAQVPAYTAGDQAPEPLQQVPGSGRDAARGEEADRAENRVQPQVGDAQPAAPIEAPSTRWRTAALVLAPAALVVGLLAAPGVVRRRRRERRLSGGVLDGWAELRDTAVDLGTPWPDERSPREVRSVVARHLGTTADLDVVVSAVERARYARPADTSDTAGTSGTDQARDADESGVRDACRRCLATMEERSTPRDRRRARWWPRTVVSRRARRRPTAGDEDVADRPLAEQLR